MINKILQNILFLCIIASISAWPFFKSECGNHNFTPDKKYVYLYETNTTLQMTHVTDNRTSSNHTFKSLVEIRLDNRCAYSMTMKPITSRVDESTPDDFDQLSENPVVFEIESDGLLKPNVLFDREDSIWSRNIKRGVISAFLYDSPSTLMPYNSTLYGDYGPRGRLGYETDVFGKCRTVYTMPELKTSQDFIIRKKKYLQTCSLNEKKEKAFPYAWNYDSKTEYDFVDSHSCVSTFHRDKLNSVACVQTSYAFGSKIKVHQNLQFVTSESQENQVDFTPKSNQRALGIEFEYDYSVEKQSPASMEFVTEFMAYLCSQDNLNQGVLTHAVKFKKLVNILKSFTYNELVLLITNKDVMYCKLASLNLAQSYLYVNTDASIEVVLELLEQNAYDDFQFFGENWIITVLAKNQNPSAELLNTMKNYLLNNPSSKHLNKLYLIYSTYIHTFCSSFSCSSELLDYWSSVFSHNLEDACQNDKPEKTIISSLKAIGNIGYINDVHLLEDCATNKKNSIEIGVNALQALRRFSCEKIEDLDSLYQLLEDTEEDVEKRINAFHNIIKCGDNSEKFAVFARDSLTEFLLKEQDLQLLHYIVVFGQNNGLTTILNSILNTPEIYKKLNPNRFHFSTQIFEYEVAANNVLKVATSVIYVPGTSIPRTLSMNLTNYLGGISVNPSEVTLRFDGSYEFLKQNIFQHFNFDVYRKIMNDPKVLLEVMQKMANEFENKNTKLEMSLSMRMFGSDLFFSKLETQEDMSKFISILKNPLDILGHNKHLYVENAYLLGNDIKQPLLNGLEFNMKLELSCGLLVIKDKISDSNSIPRYFKWNYLFSSSNMLEMQHIVRVKDQSQMSVKHQKFLNGNLFFNIESTVVPERPEQVYQRKLTFNFPVFSELPVLTYGRRLFLNDQDLKFTSIHKYDGYDSETDYGLIRRTIYKHLLIDAYVDHYPQSEDMIVENYPYDPDFNELERLMSYRYNIEGLVNMDSNYLSVSTVEYYVRNPELIKTIEFVFHEESKSSHIINYLNIYKTTPESREHLREMTFIYVNRVDEVESWNKKLSYFEYKTQALRHFQFELRRPNSTESQFKVYLEVFKHGDEKFAINWHLKNTIILDLEHKLTIKKDATLETAHYDCMMRLMKNNAEQMDIVFDLQDSYEHFAINWHLKNKIISDFEHKLTIKKDASLKTSRVPHYDCMMRLMNNAEQMDIVFDMQDQLGTIKSRFYVDHAHDDDLAYNGADPEYYGVEYQTVDADNRIFSQECEFKESSSDELSFQCTHKNLFLGLDFNLNGKFSNGLGYSRDKPTSLQLNVEPSGARSYYLNALSENESDVEVKIETSEYPGNKNRVALFMLGKKAERLSGIYDYYIKSRSTIQLEPSDIWHSLSIKNDLTPNQEGIQIQVRETEFDGLVKKATLNARRNDFENGHLTYDLNFSNEFDGNLTGKLSLSTTAEPDNQAVALNIEVRTPSEILLLASGKLYNLMDLDYGISWNAENNIFLEFQSSLNLICDGTVQRELSTLTPRINYDFSLTSDLIHFKFQTDLESTRNSLNSIVYVEGKEGLFGLHDDLNFLRSEFNIRNVSVELEKKKLDFLVDYQLEKNDMDDTLKWNIQADVKALEKKSEINIHAKFSVLDQVSDYLNLKLGHELGLNELNKKIANQLTLNVDHESRSYEYKLYDAFISSPGEFCRYYVMEYNNLRRDYQYSVFFKRNNTWNDSEKIMEYSLGSIETAEIDGYIFENLASSIESATSRSHVQSLTFKDGFKTFEKSFDYEYKLDGKTTLKANSGIYNRVDVTGLRSTGNIGGYLHYQIEERNNYISADVFIETANSRRMGPLEANLDFNYELDYKATNRFAELLGVSLFNTRFIVDKTQNLNARFALETVKNDDKEYFEIKSSGGLKTHNEEKQFDVVMTKRVGNEPPIESTGTASYKLRNLLDMECAISIPDQLKYHLVLHSSGQINENPLAYHEFRFISDRNNVSRDVGLLLKSTANTNLLSKVNWKYHEDTRQYSFCIQTNNTYSDITSGLSSSENYFELTNPKYKFTYAPNFMHDFDHSDISGSVLVSSKSEYFASDQDNFTATHDFVFSNRYSELSEKLYTNLTLAFQNKDNEKAIWSSEFLNELSDESHDIKLGTLVKYKDYKFEFGSQLHRLPESNLFEIIASNNFDEKNHSLSLTISDKINDDNHFESHFIECAGEINSKDLLFSEVFFGKLQSTIELSPNLTQINLTNFEFDNNNEKFTTQAYGSFSTASDSTVTTAFQAQHMQNDYLNLVLLSTNPSKLVSFNLKHEYEYASGSVLVSSKSEYFASDQDNFTATHDFVFSNRYSELSEKLYTNLTLAFQNKDNAKAIWRSRFLKEQNNKRSDQKLVLLSTHNDKKIIDFNFCHHKNELNDSNTTIDLTVQPKMNMTASFNSTIKNSYQSLAVELEGSLDDTNKLWVKKHIGNFNTELLLTRNGLSLDHRDELTYYDFLSGKGSFYQTELLISSSSNKHLPTTTTIDYMTNSTMNYYERDYEDLTRTMILQPYSFSQLNEIKYNQLRSLNEIVTNYSSSMKRYVNSMIHQTSILESNNRIERGQSVYATLSFQRLGFGAPLTFKSTIELIRQSGLNLLTVECDNYRLICKLVKNSGSFEQSSMLMVDDNDSYGYEINSMEKKIDFIVPKRTIRATVKKINDNQNALQLQWDVKRDLEKSAIFSLGSDRNSITFNITDTPHFKIIQVNLNRARNFNETSFGTSAWYQLKNKEEKNRLDITAKLRSNLNTYLYSVEANLVKPSFNFFYQNKFNRVTGSMEDMTIKVGKLLSLNIDKEKHIFMELTSPNRTIYLTKRYSAIKNQNVFYLTQMEKANGVTKIISEVKSSFSIPRNLLNVEISGTNNTYNLNCLLFNEYMAQGVLKNKNTGEELAVAKIKLVKSFDELDIILEWKPFWKLMKQELLGDYSFDISGEMEIDELEYILEHNMKEAQSIADDYHKLLQWIIVTERGYSDSPKYSYENHHGDYSDSPNNSYENQYGDYSDSPKNSYENQYGDYLTSPTRSESFYLPNYVPSTINYEKFNCLEKLSIKFPISEALTLYQQYYYYSYNKLRMANILKLCNVHLQLNQ